MRRACHPLPVFIILVFIIMALMLAGCGLKADPRPKTAAPPEVIRDLIVKDTALGALLEWRLAGDAGQTTGFRVQRAEINQACPTCPQRYVPIASLTRGEAAQKQGGATFRFLDRDARANIAYSWRVSACQDKGGCLDSAPVGREKKE